jgi:hypothetical protein
MNIHKEFKIIILKKLSKTKLIKPVIPPAWEAKIRLAQGKS